VGKSRFSPNVAFVQRVRRARIVLARGGWKPRARPACPGEMAKIFVYNGDTGNPCREVVAQIGQPVRRYTLIPLEEPVSPTPEPVTPPPPNKSPNRTPPVTKPEPEPVE